MDSVEIFHFSKHLKNSVTFLITKTLTANELMPANPYFPLMIMEILIKKNSNFIINVPMFSSIYVALSAKCIENKHF